MKAIKLIFAAALTVFLAACGSTPQPTVQLQKQLLNAEKRVGIYVDVINEPTTNIYGAGCLLCYGVAVAANSSLSKHLESLPTSDIESSKQILLEGYKAKTGSVEFIELTEQEFKKLKKFKGELGYAKKDFRSLKESKNIDVLVVLDIATHGAYRGYTNYVPNTDPQGYVRGLVYSVDLETNQYLQYLELDKKVVVDGEWDEPKQQFPGVTNAYYQAVEQVKETINKIFL
ncbi:hypothetical protein N480_11340 [Pseudoalteromonas luteoviolacea S2607]|uniref:hypothetical protein n=1 Tax=Pseudoalteromonas luteoviolacea TaxID=43657 RepID=UPI0007B03906|nr:hypothetical protein [Pseudoalteromonas luteoviolacea]KZN28679.1 hypothetical protein N480_11340 [Pseudoalteromonas luteoviolacea S2607]